MKETVAWIIRLIHTLILIFIGTAPFFGGEYFLSIHFLVIPFIMLHWVTNQTVCALTEMEKLVRGTRDDEQTFFGQIFTPIYKSETFIGKLVRPVFEFKDAETEELVVWVGITLLWVITLIRLWPTGFTQLRADFAALRRLVPV
jgi:hypothetical protein